MYKLDDLIKPLKLNPGDKVAAITLSWGGPGAFPYRFEIGKKRLEEIFDLQVIPTKHAIKSADWIYKNPNARADDLINAFLDPGIKGIISTIGGDDSIRLIPFVDLNILRQNPKIFLGYSDTTITHFMCLKAGLRSFYGPAIMTAFAENVEMHDYTVQGIRTNLFSNEIVGEIPKNTEGWTTELLDWSNQSNQNIKRVLNSPKDWNFIGDTQKIVQGRLIGGCLESLEFIKGTELWPDVSIWNEAILFLETSEEGIAPTVVRRFMRNLAAQNILKRIKGILFSKPGGKDMTADQFPEYDQALLSVFDEYALPYIPIVTGMDFGHSDPIWTLPYGALTEINPIKKTISILENVTN